MKKLKLDVGSLEVRSFETLPVDGAGHGTVEAYSSPTVVVVPIATSIIITVTIATR